MKNLNDMNNRSFLYGRMIHLLDVYEKEARDAIGSKGATYIDMHIQSMSAKPYVTTKLCMEYLFARTSFGRIMRSKKPEVHSKLMGIINEVLATIDELHGDNNEPLYYAAVFGEFWQMGELENEKNN